MWAVAVVLVAIVLAIFGYHWLHAAQRYITWLLVVVILVYGGGLGVFGGIPAELFDLSQTFALAPFLVVTAATGYQLTWAFFVSDYSRYMPASTSKQAIIAVTSGGLFFGLFAFVGVGAVCAALVPELGIVDGLLATGRLMFPGLGELMLISGGLGLLGLMAMCVCGGSLTLITAPDSIWALTPTRKLRIVMILIIGGTGAIAAALISEDSLSTSFETILTIIGYLMAPWTSVNLTDFFFVRRGRYSVREMFRKDGVYGLVNWRGLLAYALTMLVMVPFMRVGDFEGPASVALGSVYLAFFVGIPVGCVIYWMLCRTQDLSAEMCIVEHADRDIEAVGQPV